METEWSRVWGRSGGKKRSPAFEATLSEWLCVETGYRAMSPRSVLSLDVEALSL